MSLQKFYINQCIVKKSNKVKDIDIKNGTHYFLNDIANIQNFNSDKIKIDEKSYKYMLIYYIEYVMIYFKELKYVNTNSVDPLYIIFSKANGYFEEISV